jgi:hypothetical protein
MKIPFLLVWMLSLSASAQIVFEDQSTLFNYKAPSYQATSLGDYDHDGDQDIFQANILGSAFFFINNQGRAFSNGINASGLDPITPTAGGFWADFDNDRLLDLYVSGYTAPNRLYKNNGDGTFNDLTKNLPPEPYDKMTYTAALCDYNNDGYVDIFVINFTEGNKDQLLQNNGDMSFTDVTAQSGFSAIGNGKTRSAAWCDYDSDGDADIFVGGQRQSILFINQGDGTFKPVPLNIFDTKAAVWADYDQDGDFDLTVCNGGENNPLIFINDGRGGFTKTTSILGLAGPSPYYSPLWEDFDNDSDLDLLLFGNSEGGRGLKLLQNNAAQGFSDATDASGLNPAFNGYSINAADINNDGRVDLLVGEVSLRKSFLFVNHSPEKNWIQLELAGSKSNFAAIGTVVHLFSGNRHQVLQVENNGPGTNSLVLEFGLGASLSIDSLIIQWPSGLVQVLQNIAANQRVQIVESGSGPGLDLGIESILQPKSIIQATVTVPAIVLKNYSAAAATNIWVQCLIDSGGITCFHNLKHIEQIAPFDTCLVCFEPWVPFIPCAYRIYFSVYLVGDLRPANNARTWMVRAAYDNDVSIKKVNTPQAGSNLSGRINPEIEIENMGVEAMNPFEVVCEIKDGEGSLVYRNIYMVSEMAAITGRIITFAPWTVGGAGPFSFRFEAKNTPDQYPADNVAHVTVNFQTGVPHADALHPKEYLVVANYPNPFNSHTTIRWQAPVAGRLRVCIFSSTGAPVRTVLEDFIEAGEQRILWNGENDRNEVVASGIYFCRAELKNLQGDEQSFTAKMVLLK